MRARISKGYLGESASQNPKLEDTKTIWKTRDGLRIKISELTDYHLMQAVRDCRIFARLAQLELRTKLEENREAFNSDQMAEIVTVAYANITEFCMEHIDCYKELVREAHKRELVDENGRKYENN